MARQKTYESDGISVLYDPRLCIHAAECVHRLPDVFDPKRRPWIDAGAAGPDAIARVVERCPSGALTYVLRDEPAEVPDEEATIRLSPNGPVYVRGDVTIERPDGTRTRVARVALCRCGDSNNKPFCDNSHIEAGFTG